MKRKTEVDPNWKGRWIYTKYPAAVNVKIQYSGFIYFFLRIKKRPECLFPSHPNFEKFWSVAI